MTEETDTIPGMQSLRLDSVPQRDLWPGIASRLGHRRRRWVPLAAAASVLTLLAALVALNVPQQVPPSADVQTALLAPMPLSADSRAIVKAHLGMVRHAQRELQGALTQTPEAAGLQALLVRTTQRREALETLLL